MYNVCITLNSEMDIQPSDYVPITDKVQKYIRNILKTIIPPIKVSNIKQPEQ